MTSLKQIEANRRNAFRSTGPRSEEGKQRSSRNALRHGLTAETVLKPLEDPEDYKLFEEAITAEYDAESAVERELVLRLASLLWRLRRASSIEATLFELAAEVPPERQKSTPTEPSARHASFPSLFRRSEKTTRVSSNQPPCTAGSAAPSCQNDTLEGSRDTQREIARRFQRLAKLDNGVFERLNRYELALWRQARQTLFTLEALRWRNRTPARPYFRYHIRDEVAEKMLMFISRATFVGGLFARPPA
jgi:hypothetical protein